MRRARGRDRIVPITVGARPTAGEIAALQEPALGMSWREEDIHSMLRAGDLRGYAVTRHRPGAPILFVGAILFRTVADEGEILSLSVRRAARRRGIASTLMTTTLNSMKCVAVKNVFLEVSETNRTARAFYRRFGFKKVGVRHNYYSTKQGKIHNALVFRLEISSLPRCQKRPFA